MIVNQEQSQSSSQDSQYRESYIKKHIQPVVQRQIWGDSVSDESPENFSLHSDSGQQDSHDQEIEQRIDENKQPTSQINDDEGIELVLPTVTSPEQPDVCGQGELVAEKGYYRLDAPIQGEEQEQKQQINEEYKQYIELMRKRQNQSPKRQQPEIAQQAKRDLQEEQSQRGPVCIGGNYSNFWGVSEPSQSIEQKRHQSQKAISWLPYSRSKSKQQNQKSHPQPQMEDFPIKQKSQQEQIRLQQRHEDEKGLKEHSPLVSEEQLDMLTHNIVRQMRTIVKEEISQQRQSRERQGEIMQERLERSIRDTIKVQMGQFQRQYLKQMNIHNKKMELILHSIKTSEKRFVNLEKKLGIDPLDLEEDQ